MNRWMELQNLEGPWRQLFPLRKPPEMFTKQKGLQTLLHAHPDPFHHEADVSDAHEVCALVNGVDGSYMTGDLRRKRRGEDYLWEWEKQQCFMVAGFWYFQFTEEIKDFYIPICQHCWLITTDSSNISAQYFLSDSLREREKTEPGQMNNWATSNN